MSFSCQTMIEVIPLKKRLIFGVLGITCIALFAGLLTTVLLSFSRSTDMTPQRTESIPQRLSVVPSPSIQTNTPEQTKTPLIAINAAPITSIAIPAIGVRARASGSILPRRSPLCKASEKCMDPPILNEVAWSGVYGVPSSPSKDAVLIYGHSNYRDKHQQVFNDLPAMVKGDKIIVTTEKGVFTFGAIKNPLTIPFSEVGFKRSLYTHTPGRLVLFTCGIADTGNGYTAASVIVAELTNVRTLD